MRLTTALLALAAAALASCGDDRASPAADAAENAPAATVAKADADVRAAEALARR